MNLLLAAAFETIGKALDIVKYNQANQWRSRAAQAQLELQKEWEKGYNRDDAKVEHMIKELKILLEQAAHEISSTSVSN